MRELSLNILDVAQNSISAGASLVEINVIEQDFDSTLTVEIKDNGCGMDGETLKKVQDRFIRPERQEKSAWAYRFLKWRRK